MSFLSDITLPCSLCDRLNFGPETSQSRLNSNEYPSFWLFKTWDSYTYGTSSFLPFILTTVTIPITFTQIPSFLPFIKPSQPQSSVLSFSHFPVHLSELIALAFLFLMLSLHWLTPTHNSHFLHNVPFIDARLVSFRLSYIAI